MYKPRRQHRRRPYYKVQVFDEVFQSWRDQRGAFDTVAAARAYISERKASGSARIMIVDGDRRRVLGEAEVR